MNNNPPFGPRIPIYYDDGRYIPVTIDYRHTAPDQPNGGLDYYFTQIAEQNKWRPNNNPTYSDWLNPIMAECPSRSLSYKKYYTK